jgi:hypothetical protein
LVTNSFAPWYTVIIEKLIVAQQSNSFPSLYGTPSFIIVFTGTRHHSISTWIQSTTPPPPPTSDFLRYNFILSSHLRILLPIGLFLSGFPTKNCYVFLISPCLLHALPIKSPWFNHTNNIRWRVWTAELLNV